MGCARNTRTEGKARAIRVLSFTVPLCSYRNPHSMDQYDLSIKESEGRWKEGRENKSQIRPIATKAVSRD